MAIDRETVIAIAPRPDRMLQVWSLNLDDSQELDLNKLGAGRRGMWIDYVEGIASALASRGITLKGAEIALNSDVGIGSGLSSSAALETAVERPSFPFQESSSIRFARPGRTDSRARARRDSLRDHGSVHVCACPKGARDSAGLPLLEAKQIPLNLGECRVVICDSRVRHTLASSEYNRRRQDCESAVKSLSAVLPGIHALRDVTLDQLEKHRSRLDDTVYRRCRHVISENDRTLKAAEALTAGNVAGMGRLMAESHRSLRDDYEVSCSELDILVERAAAQPGVLGARMTGGGFGGCTVNLVSRSEFRSFRQRVTEEYQARTGISPEIFAAEASAGAEEIVSN